MTKIQKTMLFSLLMLAFILYAIWQNKAYNKPIIIEPIKMDPLVINEEPSPKIISKPTDASDILRKLRLATTNSQEKVKPSKEVRANKILNRLKKQTSTQIKVQVQRSVAVGKRVKTKIKKKEIKKKVIKRTTQVIQKVAVKKKKIVTKNQKPLSREEEVALYKSQYADQLEVVGISENFEIEEPIDTLPDAYYFEKQEILKVPDTSNAALNYVKKLGVVDVSNIYEVNFSIPD